MGRPRYHAFSLGHLGDHFGYAAMTAPVNKDARSFDVPPTKLPPLRHKGCELEAAASLFNSVAQRCANGQATIDEFEQAQLAHDLAYADFRAHLQMATGESAAAIERWLSL
jgi:hypothetical protein